MRNVRRVREKLRPVSLGPDWRRTAVELVWSRIDRTWLPGYDVDARLMVDQALSRAFDSITSFGRVDLTDCGRDAIVKYETLDPNSLGDRGDLRHSSKSHLMFLRENVSLDLVPIVVGIRADGPWIMDGHHRVRAYRQVGRAVKALTVKVVRGSGQIILDLPTGPRTSGEE